jgi:hypothetical protein
VICENKLPRLRRRSALKMKAPAGNRGLERICATRGGMSLRRAGPRPDMKTQSIVQSSFILCPNSDSTQNCPLAIPTVMDLVMLADVRKLLGHLPKETRAKSTWQHVKSELDKAAAGADPRSVSVALRLVLMLEIKRR